MPTLDRADVVAESLVAFWTRPRTLESSTRQLCGRLAEAVDPAGALADAAREDLDGAIARVGAAVRAAVERDGEVAGIAQRLAPWAPPPPRSFDLSSLAAHVTRGGGELEVRHGSTADGSRPFAGGGRPAVPVRETRAPVKNRVRRKRAAAKVGTVLVVSADPTDQKRLRLQNEEREIRETLDLSTARDRWLVNPRGSVRLRDLTRALLQLSPRIVHFSGHGSIEGGVYLEDEIGMSHRIPEDALAELFVRFGESVECVVLNACLSEPQARAIARHVPFVVGTVDAVPDAAAVEFSVGFYTALGEGRDISEAHALGCIHFKSADHQGFPPPVLVRSS